MFQFQLFQLVFRQFHNSLFLYIIIYILVSYIYYYRNLVPRFLIGTFGTGTEAFINHSSSMRPPSAMQSSLYTLRAYFSTIPHPSSLILLPSNLFLLPSSISHLYGIISVFDDLKLYFITPAYNLKHQNTRKNRSVFSVLFEYFDVKKHSFFPSFLFEIRRIIANFAAKLEMSYFIHTKPIFITYRYK